MCLTMRDFDRAGRRGKSVELALRGLGPELARVYERYLWAHRKTYVPYHTANHWPVDSAKHGYYFLKLVFALFDLRGFPEVRGDARGADHEPSFFIDSIKDKNRIMAKRSQCIDERYPMADEHIKGMCDELLKIFDHKKKGLNRRHITNSITSYCYRTWDVRWYDRLITKRRRKRRTS